VRVASIWAPNSLAMRPMASRPVAGANRASRLSRRLSEFGIASRRLELDEKAIGASQSELGAQMLATRRGGICYGSVAENSAGQAAVRRRVSGLGSTVAGSVCELCRDGESRRETETEEVRIEWASPRS